MSKPTEAARIQHGPKLLGRVPDDDSYPDPRSSTVLKATQSVDFVSGAVGVSIAEAFVSEDDEDRGGCVLRLRIMKGTSTFIPHAVLLPEGVDIHLAGDHEAASTLHVLRDVIDEVLKTTPLGRHLSEAPEE